MKVLIDHKGRERSGTVIVERDTDPPYKDRAMNDESQLLHNLKRELQGRPGPFGRMDLVKKRMHKDGHLVAEEQQYIRDRRGRFAIYDDHYAVRDSAEEFNSGARVCFRLELLKEESNEVQTTNP